MQDLNRVGGRLVGPSEEGHRAESEKTEDRSQETGDRRKTKRKAHFFLLTTGFFDCRLQIEERLKAQGSRQKEQKQDFDSLLTQGA